LTFRLLYFYINIGYSSFQEPARSNQQPYFEKFRDTCQTENSKALMQFMIDVDAKIDMFATCKIDCLFEVMTLVVLPEYGQHGIGRKLVENSIRLAQCLKDGECFQELSTKYRKSRPQAVSAIFSSRFSQKIGTYLRFETLAEIFYTDCAFNGKTYAEQIGSLHPSSLLVFKKL
jgi:GNAT superfamily N-acetyltransferase